MAVKHSIKEKAELKLKVPKRYAVVMHNDDFTPMDFVVEILVRVFNKELPEATELMMQVHKGSRCVVGTYSYDIAKTKTERAMALAREQGHPFRVTVEEG